MTWQELVQHDVSYRNGVPHDLGAEELWTNDLYVVHRNYYAGRDGGPNMVHLSIRRADRKPCTDWRDFQRIKNQLAGPEWEGVELYPAESRLVDMADQYHIWCFDVPFLGIGYNEGRLIARTAQTQMLTPGATQRDPEPIDLKHGGVTSLKKLKEHLEVDDYRPKGSSSSVASDHQAGSQPRESKLIKTASQNHMT